MKFILKLKQFLKEVRMEMKRVNWLTRKDVFRYTLMVVVFSLAVAAYLGAIDFVVQWIIAKYIV
ncbi:MAG: preprotein translocase subunit SecE [Candidatus Spechtbacteria bacterium RIFCSPHIGHO2_02_FULL_43_15b]|uniref:Protein translocase subunit SecE n=1 Tax=Candidatus Spechtbacteria bacterium RIFCSPHIGHO2_01_FULL_43_30 TaxID=1802158 RepID=A0A1G2H8R7_9BACT|nr:MAG: preprotein translocase subunit SecE [Candidatus Spechtbacteria bacterium RIFCSPHIGHO2_01_FULL_43_30]OGZ59127.1 MAG: preprotein translocase subunit SecE [Candidatus Spechtbacteria bacterium RIFCSPHIGHO2_02_FULL_43_15b]